MVLVGSAALVGPSFIAPAKAASFIPGIQTPEKSILDPVTNKLYVIGLGSIAAIDASTNQLIKYITVPGDIDVGRGVQLFVNPSTNMVYVFAAFNQVYVIDSTTDTIVKTATISNGLNGTYNPQTNRFYVSGTDASGVGQIFVIDGTTLAQIDAIPAGLANAPIYNGGPTALLVNPATNRLYAMYDTPTDTNTGLKIIDTTTDTVLSETACTPTNCGVDIASLRLPGSSLGMVLNPADNSVWISSDVTVGGFLIGGGDNGGGGGVSGGSIGTGSEFYQIDPVTNAVSKFFGAYGLDYIKGFDPSTGLLYGVGEYLPTADPATVTTGLPNTGAPVNLVTVDTTAASPVMTAVRFDSSTAITSCGSATPLAIDIPAKNIYWGCAAPLPGVATSTASIVISKMDFTPNFPGVFPVVEFSQFVAQLATPSRSLWSGLTNFNSIDNINTQDKPTNASGAMFALDTSFDMVLDVNPATLSAAGVQLTAPQFIPDPPAAPTFSIQGRIADSSNFGIQGVPVTLTNGTTTTVIGTNTNGAFTFPSNVAGTYTVSYDPTGLVPSGATSQTVAITNANIAGVNFQALNTPIAVTSVTWPSVSGGSMNFTAGQFVGGFVQLNEPAPAGGIVVTLTSSNAKALKSPATVTIPAGSSGNGFSAQAQGVSAMTTATVTASYQGMFAPAGTSGTSPSVTIYPSESIKVTSATWSKSSTVLTVTATDNVTFSALSVQDGKTSTILGSMSTSGNGTYTFQTTMATAPSSVNILSSLGAKVGQGVSTVN